MVALPVAPNCLRFRITGKINTASIAHIMHAQFAGGTPSVTDANAIALLLRNAFNTRFGGLLPTTVTYSLFEVADLSTITGAVGNNTTPVTGTVSALAGMLNSSCAVVSWKVGVRYRGGHARTYFPYGSSINPTGGNAINSTYQANLKTAAGGFITDVNAFTSGTVTMSFAVVSYFHGKVMRPTGIPFLITAADVHGRIDTQRRRLGKEF